LPSPVTRFHDDANFRVGRYDEADLVDALMPTAIRTSIIRSGTMRRARVLLHESTPTR